MTIMLRGEIVVDLIAYFELNIVNILMLFENI